MIIISSEMIYCLFNYKQNREQAMAKSRVFAWLIMGYFVHKNANKADIKDSLARTRDPEYVNLLVKAGYRIYPVE